jgi:hypothetical protein
LIIKNFPIIQESQVLIFFSKKKKGIIFHSFLLKASALYWHFVDVVWLFLYISIILKNYAVLIMQNPFQTKKSGFTFILANPSSILFSEIIFYFLWLFTKLKMKSHKIMSNAIKFFSRWLFYGVTGSNSPKPIN